MLSSEYSKFGFQSRQQFCAGNAKGMGNDEKSIQAGQMISRFQKRNE